MLGYRAEELVGKLTPAIIHDPSEVVERAAELSEELGVLIEPGFDTFVSKPKLLGIPDEREWAYIRKDGSRFPVLLSITALRNAQNVIDGYLGIGVDIIERKQSEALLREQAEWMRLATTTAGIGMWIHDIETQSLKWDARMHEIYALPVEKFRGEYADWRERLHPEDRARVESQFNQSMANARPFQSRYRLLLPDGSIRHIAASAGLVKDTDGRPISMVGVNHEITDQVAREDRLKKALADLAISAREAVEARIGAEAANRAKSEFLATMSHEIRTPMNGVLGFTELLLDTELCEQQRAYVSTIQRSGESLLLIINDILDLSKIEAGKFTLDFQPFDLNQTAGDIFTLLNAQAEAKGLELRLDYASALPQQIFSDPQRMRQVLLNLVSNALKFTEHGSVILRVRQVENAVQKALRIEVVDTGIGLSQEQQERLFQKFVQVDSSTTRRFGGTGLGLIISKRLVEMMGGQIGVESQLGKGATFWFTIPLVALPVPVPVPVPAAAQISTPRILVAEDNEVNRMFVLALLRKLGCEVDVAVNGVDAVRLFKSQPYAAILMDCHMPEMDGYAATVEIRRLEELQEKASHIPIIALTASVMQEDRDRCIAVGMDAFLTKPLRREELKRVFDQWLSSR